MIYLWFLKSNKIYINVVDVHLTAANENSNIKKHTHIVHDK